MKSTDKQRRSVTTKEGEDQEKKVGMYMGTTSVGISQKCETEFLHI